MADKRQALLVDLGGAESLSVIRLDLVGRYAELGFLADDLIANLVTTGPLTSKGRSRAALKVWMALVDRQTRLGLELGLARGPKPVASPLDFMRGKVDA